MSPPPQSLQLGEPGMHEGLQELLCAHGLAGTSVSLPGPSTFLLKHGFYLPVIHLTLLLFPGSTVILSDSFVLLNHPSFGSAF